MVPHQTIRFTTVNTVHITQHWQPPQKFPSAKIYSKNLVHFFSSRFSNVRCVPQSNALMSKKLKARKTANTKNGLSWAKFLGVFFSQQSIVLHRSNCKLFFVLTVLLEIFDSIYLYKFILVFSCDLRWKKKHSWSEWWKSKNVSRLNGVIQHIFANLSTKAIAWIIISPVIKLERHKT